MEAGIIVILIRKGLVNLRYEFRSFRAECYI